MKQSEPKGDVQEANRGVKIRHKERALSPKTSHVAGERGNRFRRLVEACKRKELDAIRRLLAEQPELLNYHDKHHRNLLHYAAILVVDDERLEGERGQRRRQLLADCLDCFRYLTSKCEPKLWFQVDRDGLTVLHLAVISCNSPLVREILFNQSSQATEFKRQRKQQFELASLITALDKEKHSPLHWAVITNNLECVRLLTEHSGVQLVHQADLNGATPLHYATQTSDYPKYRQQLRQMLKNATASGQRSSTTSPCSSSSSSPSASSCVSGRRDSSCVRAADEKQVNFNSIRGHQQHASNNLEILDFLACLPGVNLECRDKDQRTPLLWAASSGNRQAILLLLQSGANYLCQDANKLGPLHCAASHGYTDCLECLVLLSASTTTSQIINQADNLNCTPLFYAVLSGNIDCVELLLDRGAKKDWQDVKGRTAAHFGALRGQLNTLKLLEAHGANLWLANKQGDLPLHYAIKSGRQQVVAWLLERSPYERPVNAINNTGRAPIHLAILRNNANMVDFLIRCGANLNQLVKMRDKSAPPTSDDVQLALVNANGVHQTRSSTSTFHYETALDMAKRLNQQDLVELLERNSAKSAASVLANRQAQTGLAQAGPAGANVRSLFDLQAADVASPIGFETGGSSAEPSSDQQRSTTGARLPKISMRPKAMAEPVPQSSDSANSSALSHSSPTSLHGQPPKAQKLPARNEQLQNQSAASGGGGGGSGAAAQPRRRPFKGGMNYNNDRISASIKCKLYENKTTTAAHSFPPLANTTNGQHKVESNQRHRYHSSGSLSEQATGCLVRGSHSSAGGGQQEIITNVNVYTSSPCAQCLIHGDGSRSQQLQRKCPNCSSQDGHNNRGEVTATRSKATQLGLPLDGMISETSDSTDATSTIYDESERDDELDFRVNTHETATHLPALTNLADETSRVVGVDSQPVRYMPTLRNHTQHLPVILSAEEERSTSGETDTNQQRGQQVVESPDDFVGPVPPPPPLSSCGPFAGQEPRFDRAQRGRVLTRHVDRLREQARSPVAEYIHARDRQVNQQRQLVSETTRSNWAQQQQQQQPRIDYSQIKAKVDSHRNDSGLSSHFGDELDSSLGGGRRSKSWSSSYSAQPEQPLASGQLRRIEPPSGRQQVDEQLAGGNQSRSCSRQTIIKTRRLSVDTDELATSIEKSIRRYKHESKLFEELQNLKRSQIRSGRANESLLVKRLAEHFRQEVLQDCLIGLDVYRGPYTYQAYELYLYDQLKKLSQTNYAMLMGSRVAHKFTHHDPMRDPMHDQEQSQLSGAAEKVPSLEPMNNQEAREFLEEELKAEQELQRVLTKRSSMEATTSESVQEASPTPIGRVDESIAIEPSGALEDIRVRQRAQDEEPDSQPAEATGQLLQAGDGEEKCEQDQDEEVGESADDLAIRDRLEKQVQRTSTSTGSSRRSSVELEQEKLDRLPLRVNQLDKEQKPADFVDDERQQIEKEAIDLTSAILVDALGNVSRAGSPQRFRQLDESQSDAQEQDQQQEQKSGDEQQVEEATNEAGGAQGRGRRRSVVNIGDKIEVIYHKVGIEIDTVAENEDAAEEEAEDDQEASAVRERRESGHGEVSEAAEELQHSEPEATTELGAGEEIETKVDGEEVEEDSSRHSRAGTVVRGTTEEDGDELSGSHERRKSSAAQIAQEAVDSLKPASRHSLRRASSPQARSKTTSETTMQQVAGGGGSRRSSSPIQQTADAMATRRIFNGFDLDTLREHRRAHQLAREQKLVAAEGTAAAEAVGSDGVKVRKSTRKQPRKPRTHLPKGPYEVYVPNEVIRDRWNQVKRQEQARSSSNVLKVAPDELSHAVSQPNLSTRQKTGLGQAESESCSNFILIYELNKPRAGGGGVGGDGGGGDVALERLEQVETTTPKRMIWCQKRMTRIVDVRTLKRTLSLPESLIYSNELLKRFNLLKL